MTRHRVVTGPGARFHFTPEYLAQQGGAIVERPSRLDVWAFRPKGAPQLIGRADATDTPQEVLIGAGIKGHAYRSCVRIEGAFYLFRDSEEARGFFARNTDLRRITSHDMPPLA